MHPFSCFLLPHLPSFCLVCTMCIWVYRRAAPTADPDVRGKLNRMAFGAQFRPDGTCQPQERGQCPALSLLTMTLAGVVLHQTCGSLFVFATTTAEQYSCSLLVPSLLAVSINSRFAAEEDKCALVGILLSPGINLSI